MTTALIVIVFILIAIIGFLVFRVTELSKKNEEGDTKLTEELRVLDDNLSVD